MYGCESWIIKKVEHQRINASKLWYWRRHLRVPWTVRRSNQSIRLLVTPWSVAHQVPLSMRFSRQEYWSGFPFPSPGDRSYPRIKPTYPPLAGEFFTTEPPGSFCSNSTSFICIEFIFFQPAAIFPFFGSILSCTYFSFL